MTAHSELLARLEGASKGSRELDREIMGLFYRMGERFIGIECDCCPDGRHVTPVWIDPQTDEWKTTALDGFEFTTCVTAALALAERVLPGWMFAVAGPWTNTVVGRDFYCAEVVACTEASGVGYREVNELGNEAATPALALCIAVLRAQPQPDGEKT